MIWKVNVQVLNKKGAFSAKQIAIDAPNELEAKKAAERKLKEQFEHFEITSLSQFGK